jgi:hypothetical protein
MNKANTMQFQDVVSGIILGVIVVFAIVLLYFLYKMCITCEPDEPDSVRLGIIPPVVVHADSRVVPILTTATYVNADYHVVNAEYAEETKTEEDIRSPENLV